MALNLHKQPDDYRLNSISIKGITEENIFDIYIDNNFFCNTNLSRPANLQSITECFDTSLYSDKLK